MSETPIAAKIAALMAKADSTEHAEEAQAFYSKAEKLMLKHAVSMAEVRAAHTGAAIPEAEEIVRWCVPFPYAQARWRVLGRIGAALIADATGLVGVAVSERRREVALYGREADVRHVEQLVSAVWRQAERHLKEWRKSSIEYRLAVAAGDSAAKTTLTNSFTYGFVEGAVSQIKEAHTQFLSETPGAELVLSGHLDRIEEEMTGIRKSRARSISVTDKARSAGFSVGRSTSYAAELAG